MVKIGSSSITHPETGAPNFTKLEILVRELRLPGAHEHGEGLEMPGLATLDPLIRQAERLADYEIYQGRFYFRRDRLQQAAEGIF